MATEKLKFRLELYATMWDQPPKAEILLDDKSHFDGEIRGTQDKPNLIEFEAELDEDSEYTLVIRMHSKNNNQTVIDEKSHIVKDQLLHIKSVEIDEIDIGALVYEGIYTPNYPEPWATQQMQSGKDLKDSFKNVTQMGWNGNWRLKFKSPFYMWLLENLY